MLVPISNHKFIFFRNISPGHGCYENLSDVLIQAAHVNTVCILTDRNSQVCTLRKKRAREPFGHPTL